MATFNIQLPNVRQLDWNDKKTQNMLLDFFNELTEKLNYTLNNMDFTNFDRQTYVDLSKATEQSNASELIEQISEAEEQEREDLFNRLKDLVTQKAYEITQSYTALFEQDDEKLQSVYSLVTDAQALDEHGNKMSLQQSWATSIEQTASEIKATASSAAALAASANNLRQEFEDRVTSYLTFDNTGLTIGKEGSDFKTFINNQRLSFMQGSDTIAYISGNKLYITTAEITNDLVVNGSATVNNLAVGSGSYLFEWFIDSNNSFSLRKKV